MQESGGRSGGGGRNKAFSYLNNGGVIEGGGGGAGSFPVAPVTGCGMGSGGGLGMAAGSAKLTEGDFNEAFTGVAVAARGLCCGGCCSLWWPGR